MLTALCKPWLLCLFFIASITIHGQGLQQKLDSFSGTYISSIRGHERAQAVLQTDKSVFSAGENIWFRVFLLNSVNQKVYTKSKYLFVDLVNDNDNVIATKLLDAGNQQLDGKMIIPSNATPGYYWLRAYTRQMAEADSNYSSVKRILVVNQNSKPEAKQVISKAPNTTYEHLPVLKFYPEGGAIITGTNSTVAFRIQKPDGMPVATQGYVKDNRDSIVAQFTSDTFGLGKFTVRASPYRKYKAYMHWSGKEFSYPLPPFDFHAGQIAVTQRTQGKITLQVLLEDSIYKKNVVTYLVGINKDSLCFAAIGHDLYEMEVPEEKLPPGITTFYLFDSSFHFLSDRSVYVQKHNALVKTSLDKREYHRRDKVTLEVAIVDAMQKPVPTLFSIAVVEAAFVNAEDDLALTNVINQNTASPIDLERLQSLTEQQIDLLMLARNESYKSVMQNTVNERRYDSDSLLFIKGTVYDEKDKPAVNTVLTLFSKDFGNFLIDTTGNAGRFSFAVSNYMDSTSFALEAKDFSNKNVKVKIKRDPIPYPSFKTPAYLKTYFSDPEVYSAKYQQAYFEPTSTNVSKSLPGVTVSARREGDYDQSKRVSSSSIIISSDKLDERRKVTDILQSYGGVRVNQGFLVMNGLSSWRLSGGKDDPPYGQETEPLLLINGIQAPVIGGLTGSPVMNALNSLNPKEIDFIEILKGPEGGYYGIRGGNGVILVNTRNNIREVNRPVNSNLQSFYATGISRPALFHVVNYETSGKPAESFDNRSTIYWDGSVLSNGNKQMNFSFFTNDIPTTYQITISGITVHGDIVYKTVTFNTK